MRYALSTFLKMFTGAMVMHAHMIGALSDISAVAVICGFILSLTLLRGFNG